MSAEEEIRFVVKKNLAHCNCIAKQQIEEKGDDDQPAASIQNEEELNIRPSTQPIEFDKTLISSGARVEILSVEIINSGDKKGERTIRQSKRSIRPPLEVYEPGDWKKKKHMEGND